MNANCHESVIEPDVRDEARSFDDWLDTALEQSFPASDPVPSFRGDPTPPSSSSSDDSEDTRQGA